ncbi:MAG: septum formation family protein [Actinomycetia bacterium]|nr:septum formation family protein [Actinomycetes bacterium]
MPTRILFVVLAIGVIATACVPGAGDTPETTVTEPSVTTTTSSPTTSGAQGDLEAPERGDPDDVASDAFWDAGRFKLAGEPDLFDEDALTSIERWLPEDLVDGLVWEVFAEGSDANVLAVSVIPALTWRGDPNFVPSLISTLADEEADEVHDGIYQTETTAGLELFAWSTGDGFVLASSSDSDLAVDYLKALSAESEPQRVWDSETCLYTDPESETLPYAPFPPDIVVPCSGPHNAEVLVAQQIGTDLTEFDGDVIAYDRSYECDKAYAEVFGPQKDHAPTLITYMPDEDEWDRGDRYLACVVQLDSLDGIVLMAGPMAVRDDLDWALEPEDCLDASFAPEAVECARPHGYQYLGDATVSVEEWPGADSAALNDVCIPLLDSFVTPGPVDVDVFATGLYPYAFELGDRTVRCMAFAIEEGFLADVAGSFGGVWRVIGSGGVAA